MPHKIVAMTAIPGRFRRGSAVRSDLTYFPFGRATWEWWCRNHDVDFRVIEHPVEGPLSDTPATVQRWAVARDLLDSAGPGARVAVVDADTMIRWDAPDLFDLADGELAAVRGGSAKWIGKSIGAYQEFFPGVILQCSEYFNAGVVAFSKGHAALLGSFLDFYATNKAQLLAVQRTGDYGTDQTPLNFFIKQRGTDVRFLPPTFNLLHCVGLSPWTWAWYEGSPFAGILKRRFRKVLRDRSVFDFIDSAYVWHFTNTVINRTAAMAETWRLIRDRYPGAVEPTDV